MTLRLMRIFRSVAEHKSFSRAAEELDITRPAVSQAITQLEEHLAVKLFNRTTRRVDLTAEGELYYHHVIDILERMEVMEEQLKMPFEGPAGRVRIEASPTVARSYLLPHLVSFQEAYPHIEILLSTNSHYINFNESAIDFALQVGEGSDQDLESHHLADVHFVCCAAPEYLERNGTPESLEDLEKHKAINCFSVGTGRTYPWAFLKNEGLRHIRMHHDIAVTDSETALAYTLAGKGISVIALYLADEHIQSGKLVPILAKFPLANQPLRLVHLPNKVMNQRSKLFFDWLMKTDKKPMCNNTLL